MRIAIIDGDFIPYRVAYSVEKYGGNLNTAKKKVDAIIDEICFRCNTPETIGFLQGKGNFRYQVIDNTPIDLPKYKGNRKKEKPAYYYEVIQYLKERYKFNTVNGMEVDDAVAICLTRLDGTCVSTDKDLLQVPGKHLQFTHKGHEHYTVTKEGTLKLSANRKKVIGTGDRLLWCQMLTGDGVDNFHGIPRMGPVKSVSLLENVPYKKLANTVYKEYVKAFDTDAKAMYSLTWNLAYLLRDHKDFLTPSTINVLNL